MSRVPLLTADDAPLAIREGWSSGQPGPIAASLAHVPEIYEVALPFVSRILSPSHLDLRTKELVILRTSALQECRYCTDAHTAVALKAPLSRDEVVTLRDPDGDVGSMLESPAEKALIRWTEAVALERGPVDPEIAAAMKAHWEDHEIVELTLLVGATMMLNRYCTALDLPTSAATLARLAAADLEEG